MLTFRAIEFEIDEYQTDDLKTQRSSRAFFLKTLWKWYHSEKKHIFPNGVVAGFNSPSFDIRFIDLLRLIFDTTQTDSRAAFRFVYQFAAENGDRADILITQSVDRFYDMLDHARVNLCQMA